MVQLMKQFLEENVSTIWPVALMLVWLVLTYINNYHHKKGLYFAEVAVLFINMVANTSVAWIYVTKTEAVETGLILFGWAACNLILSLFVLQDYFVYWHQNTKDDE